MKSSKKVMDFAVGVGTLVIFLTVFIMLSCILLASNWPPDGIVPLSVP